jgi:hypothetical protein
MQTIPISQAPPEGGGKPPKAQSGYHQTNIGRIANPADGQGQEERSRSAHGDPHQGIDNIPGLYPPPPVLRGLLSIVLLCSTLTVADAGAPHASASRYLFLPPK